MPRKFIKRVTPSANQVRQNRFLRRFGRFLNAHYLWQVNCDAVAISVAIGFFIAFVPLPGHMLVAAGLAILLRSNIAVAIAAVWISNPLTMLPMYGFGYWVGARIMGFSFQEIEFSSWTVILEFWQPLLLGCTLVGLASAFIAYNAVRFFWRYRVAQQWNKRRLS